MRTPRPHLAATALLTALTLGGCTMLPHENPTPTTTQKTGIELRAQILDHIHNSITATSLTDGWKTDTLPGASAWDPTTATYSGWTCSTDTTNPTDQQQFMQDIYHDPVDDPIGFVKTVGDHWRSLGYEVSNVIAPRTEPLGEREADIRADLPNGAVLGLSASDHLIWLDASTECSTDPSLGLLAGPDGYEPFPEITGTPASE